MTVKKTQKNLSTTLEKTEQTLGSLENSLGNDVEASLLVVNEVNERNTGLPVGWVFTDLAGVGNIVTGKTPTKKNPEYFNGNIPFIKPGDIRDQGFIYSTIDTISDLGAETVPTIPRGAIVVTCIGNLGRVGIAYKTSATNQQINAVIPSEMVSSQYLYYVARTLKSWMEIESSATTVAIINKSKFSKAPIPLPPLAEQTVIAQTLDTLLAQVDNIKTRLDAIPKILKTFRQSVLAAAVSGKLTEEWRGENECGEWGKCAFDTLLEEMRNGLSPKPNEDGVGYPIFRIGAVRPLEIDYSDMRYLECEDKIAERYRLQKNDLLFTRYNGSLDFVGVCGRIKEKLKGVVLYPDKLIRVRLKEDAHPSYIELYFASPSIRRLVTDFVKSTSGQKGISGKDLKSVLIALPSIQEQTQIVRRVEELFAFADQIEQQVKNAQKRVNTLTQSILAKAFRGELTTQWRAENPDLITGDNSAEALLVNIKEEREKLKTKKKISTTKTTQKTAK